MHSELTLAPSAIPERVDVPIAAVLKSKDSYGCEASGCRALRIEVTDHYSTRLYRCNYSRVCAWYHQWCPGVLGKHSTTLCGKNMRCLYIWRDLGHTCIDIIANCAGP